MAANVDTSKPATDVKGAALPNWEPPERTRMKRDWVICRDVYVGTRRFHEKAQEYLPKWPLENDESYRVRGQSYEALDAFGRGVRAMVGLVFGNNPELGEDVPPALKAHWENIDLAGTHGDVFLQAVFHDGLVTGVNGILVDYPKVPDPDAVTRRDEAELRLRPYWRHYVAEDIVQVRFGVAPASGETVMTLLVLHETVEQPLGEFGATLGQQWRVFRRSLDAVPVITAEEWVETRVRGRARIDRVGPPVALRNVSGIPFALMLFGLVDGSRTGAVECRPPLLGLAEKNVAHYQVNCDLRYVLHKAARPTLLVKGATRDEKEGGLTAIGPDVALHVPATGGAEWLEIGTGSVAAMSTERQTIQSEMASLAMAFLQHETRAAETAEGKRIDKDAQNATLSTTVRVLEDAVERAMGFHAEFLKLGDGDMAGGSVSINRDFEMLVIDVAMVTALSTMETTGQLSLETLWDLLEQGRLFPPGFDRKKEALRLLARMSEREDGLGGAGAGAGSPPGGGGTGPAGAPGGAGGQPGAIGGGSGGGGE